MKLAEALILRADTQKRIAELRKRASQNAKVQEGSRPSEDPQALMTQLRELYTQLTGLVQRINRTNTTTAFDDTLSMADALAVRDTLGAQQGMLREMAQAAVPTQDRFTRTECATRARWMRQPCSGKRMIWRVSVGSWTPAFRS